MSRLERELLTRAGDSPIPAHAPPAPAATAVSPASSGTRREATAGALGLQRRRANVAALAWTLARTDVKVRYHGTWAGFLWALLKPVAILVVLMTVFSLMFTATPDYKLRLVLGLILWDYFAEGTRVGLLSLLSKGALLSKMSLPRWTLVLTSQASALLTLTVFVCGFLLFLAAIGRFPRPGALLGFLLCLALLVVAVQGLALAMSVLFLRYRDLNQIWEVVSQAGFFLAPIVYPLDLIPERYRPLLFLWLPTPIVEFSRRALLDGRLPAMEATSLLALASVLLLALGVAIFRNQIARAAERL
jgi:lipopolysaccharide transport system permease protein